MSIITGGAEMQIRGRKMIHVGMGDQQGLHGGKIQAVLLHMRKGIRREIDEQVVVYHSLGAGAEVLAPSFQGLLAIFATAKQRGPALGGGGSQISQLHKTHFLCDSFLHHTPSEEKMQVIFLKN
jgi:hypothetical protein